MSAQPAYRWTQWRYTFLFNNSADCAAHTAFCATPGGLQFANTCATAPPTHLTTHWDDCAYFGSYSGCSATSYYAYHWNPPTYYNLDGSVSSSVC